MDRRRFLQLGAVGLPGMALAEAIARDPWAPPQDPGAGVAAPRAVRVRGRVAARGGALAGVAVSDGEQVVATGADGAFELISRREGDFLRLSVPAGHRIPRNETGTARFYRPIRGDDEGEMIASFDLEPLEASDDRHACLLLADPQTETPEEMAWLHDRTVPDVQRTVAGLGDTEVFGIANGDIMYDHLELLSDYERAVSAMGVPFFQVVGNHDLDQAATDAASTRTFSGRFGPRYYSFERGAVHYVVLDDVFWYGTGYIGYLDDDTLTWLERDLARVEAGRTVIVATHIPPIGSAHLRSGDDEPSEAVIIVNRERLYRLLEPYRAHVLAGHMHESEHLFHHGLHEHVCGAVCGAWWSGPICWDGTPNGYAVYEIRGEEVTWRYKGTGLDPDEQIRAYPRGADPAAPDEIVANVWDWDPSWSVVWYEDGERKGPMARRVGIDPLSRELHTGDELPEHRPWVDPVPTGHLFYAPASPEAREIRVEATDGFGRTYSAVAPTRG